MNRFQRYLFVRGLLIWQFRSEFRILVWKI